MGSEALAPSGTPDIPNGRSGRVEPRTPAGRRSGSSPRVAVIGGGIVGASVAYELAMRGARVTLLEMDGPGPSTSEVSFAWLNAHRKRSPAYHRLNVEGMASHRVLAADLRGEHQWYFPTGHLRLSATPGETAELEDDVAALRDLDYPATWLTRQQAEDLEPELILPPSTQRLAFFGSEGYVLPAVLIRSLTSAASEAGTAVERGARVTAVRPTSEGVDVVIADRDTVHVDRVVICAGRWSGELAEPLDLPIPLVDPTVPKSKAAAYQARTRPRTARIQRVVTTALGRMRPELDGGVLFQAQDLSEDVLPSVPEPVRREFQSRVETLLTRRERNVELAEVRVAYRSLPIDGYSIVGYLDARSTVYAAVTHSGVTLGPLLGRLVAEEMLLDKVSDLLSDFRPERFSQRKEPPASSLVVGPD